MTLGRLGDPGSEIPVIRHDGRLQQDAPEWLPVAGASAWSELAGKTAKQARTKVETLLRDAGALIGDARPIEHEVKYYEKGDRPLEIVTSRQFRNHAGRDDSPAAPPVKTAAVAALNPSKEQTSKPQAGAR